MDQDEYLTVQEVADKLKTNPRNIQSWLRKGKMKGVKLERQWRIGKKDFEEWLARRTNQ